MKGEITNAALILAAGLLSAVAIQTYYSPYNQCVRAKSELNSDRTIVIHKDPTNLAKFQCAEALGEAAE